MQNNMRFGLLKVFNCWDGESVMKNQKTYIMQCFLASLDVQQYFQLSFPLVHNRFLFLLWQDSGFAFRVWLG